MEHIKQKPTLGLWIFRAAAVMVAGIVGLFLIMALSGGQASTGANPSMLMLLPFAFFAGLKLMAFGKSMHRSQQQAEMLDAIAIEDGKMRYPAISGNLLLLAIAVVMIGGAYFLSQALFR